MNQDLNIIAMTIASRRLMIPVPVPHRTRRVCLFSSRSLGRKLRWDPAAETFPDDEEARALIDRPRRPGWELPDIT